VICFKGTGSKVSKLKTGHTTIGAQAAKVGVATADEGVTHSVPLITQAITALYFRQAAVAVAAFSSRLVATPSVAMAVAAV
jgi:hypothetical protein